MEERFELGLWSDGVGEVDDDRDDDDDDDDDNDDDDGDDDWPWFVLAIPLSKFFIKKSTKVLIKTGLNVMLGERSEGGGEGNC